MTAGVRIAHEKALLILHSALRTVTHGKSVNDTIKERYTNNQDICELTIVSDSPTQYVELMVTIYTK